jgi:serine/threonine protein kinase
MELVQGVPITEYCDQCNLTTRERLELFITVCEAVQHAHQKGIIHRDIKPTNVLVTWGLAGHHRGDGRAESAEQKVPVPLPAHEKPQVKIIDFGVAKAIGEQSLTEHTLTTAFAQMVGTPMYMSPEQAELSPLGVDTRSDIYSLGVLLYELLTGTTPFDKDRLHSASYDELRRIIREEEPPRPSARLSSLSLGERAGVRARRSGEPSRTSSDSLPLADQTSTGDSSRRAPTRSVGRSAVVGREASGEGETAKLATTIAERRRTDPRRLVQSIRGELDWIVMKCLEKDRNRRYETASSLARDIERYLADEPVQACPPSQVYRLKKFVRRNKAAAAFITLLLFSVAGLSIGNLALKRERDAKTAALAQATTEGTRAEAVSDWLENMLGFPFPDQVESSTYTVRQLLDDSVARMGVQTTDPPDVEAAIRSLIGRTYWHLGVDDRAVQQLEQALELRRKAFESNHERVAESLLELAWVLPELGRFSDAETSVHEAVSIYQKLDSTNQLANALYITALLQLRRGDKAGYRATCQALVDLPIRTDSVVIRSRPIWPLCLVPDALADMSRPLKNAEKLVRDNPNEHAHFCLYVLGAALYRVGNYAQAARRLEESIRATPGFPETDRDNNNYQCLLLAMSQWQLGRRDEARQLLSETKPAVVQDLQNPSSRWGRQVSLKLLLAEAEALITPMEADQAVENKNRISDKPEQ